MVELFEPASDGDWSVTLYREIRPGETIFGSRMVSFSSGEAVPITLDNLDTALLLLRDQRDILAAKLASKKAAEKPEIPWEQRGPFLSCGGPSMYDLCAKSCA